MRIFEENNITAHTDYQNWFVFPFERDFDPVAITVWLQNYWQHSITISIAYLALIYYGQWLMRNRKGWDLTVALVIWNAVLAVFSIMGSLRTTEELTYAVWTFGFPKTVCYSASPWGVSGFWSGKFAISKVIELGDTVFIVLRKRQLLFLHCYHHVTVLLYTWHSGAEHTAAGRWFIWMNFTVHAFMYTYYTLKSLHVYVPRRVSVLMTTMQITQMIVGIYISTTVYHTLNAGKPCQQSYENLYLCFTIYFTYFVLFAKFFWDAYVAKRKAIKTQ